MDITLNGRGQISDISREKEHLRCIDEILCAFVHRSLRHHVDSSFHEVSRKAQNMLSDELHFFFLFYANDLLLLLGYEKHK